MLFEKRASAAKQCLCTAHRDVEAQQGEDGEHTRVHAAERHLCLERWMHALRAAVGSRLLLPLHQEGVAQTIHA